MSEKNDIHRQGGHDIVRHGFVEDGDAAAGDFRERGRFFDAPDIFEQCPQKVLFAVIVSVDSEARLEFCFLDGK